MTRKSRGERAINRIESYCLFPSGPNRGERVRLSVDQRDTLRRMYDSPGGLEPVPVSGPLAAYIALLHVCGSEAVGTTKGAVPSVKSDLFSVWGAAGPELRAVLKRTGERVVCPELGTRWPSAARSPYLISSWPR